MINLFTGCISGIGLEEDTVSPWLELHGGAFPLAIERRAAIGSLGFLYMIRISWLHSL